MSVSLLCVCVMSVVGIPLIVQGQSSGDLRLVDNFGRTGGFSGRLEVYLGGRWGTVCDDSFDFNDATVACRQLNLSPTSQSSYTVGSLGFNQGSLPILLDDLRCSGSESRLIDCSHTQNHNCGHHEDVGLICSSSATSGQLRLVDNSGRTGGTSGRLEVYLSGQWGTVCDDDFGFSDATVACRQLGLFPTSQSSYTVIILGFTQGTLPILLDDLRCSGSEFRLIDCPNTQIANCGHHKDVGLICSSSRSSTSTPIPTTLDPGSGTEGDARLVGSSGLTRGMAGRVEVFTSGSWITVTESSSVGEEEADVICRQLGFPTSVYYGTVGELGFSQGFSLRVVNFFSCFGFETRWRNCVDQTSRVFVNHTDDFAVSCGGTYSSADAQSGDLRLNTVGSSRPYSGRLEIYYNGQWGTVCDDRFLKAEADVACRQLGFVEALYYGNDIGFDGGSGPIWLDDVDCSSNHRRLSDCSHLTIGSHNCQHSEDVAVVCVGEGSLRLTSGYSTSASLSSGRLEVYAGGRWGTVCDNGFGQLEADTACRGLGYGRATSYDDVRSTSNYYDNNLPILLDNVRCSSSDNFLLLCSHRGIGSDNCGHTEDIVVECSTRSTGTVIAIGVTVPLVVIIACILFCLVCCCCKLSKKKSSTLRSPRVVNTTSASRTTATTATARTGTTAYPMQTVTQQAPYPNAYPTQTGAQYSTGQYAQPYPTAYSTVPQEPSMAYPTGQVPPAPYSSGTQAPAVPYPTTSQEPKEKPTLYADAPPAYSEFINYPSPSAPGPAGYPASAGEPNVPPSAVYPPS